MKYKLNLLAVIIFGITGVAILMSLGFWQMNRLDWKEGLLADIQLRLSQPAEIYSPLNNNPDELVYGRYQVKARPLVGKSLYFYGQGNESQGVGYHIYHGFELETGKVAVFRLGFLSFSEVENRANPTNAIDQVNSFEDYEGGFLPLLNKGSFIPENDREKNVWYWHDVNEIAEHYNVDKEQLLPLTFVPKKNFGYSASPFQIQIPNTHFQYMLTWFSLSFIWGLMSIFLLIKQIKRPKA